MIPLLSDAPAKDVLHNLEEALRELGNVQGKGSDAPALLRNYLSWAQAQVRMLNRQIPPSELDRLVTTRQYFALQGSPPSESSAIYEIVGVEIESRKRDLEEAVASLNAELVRWGRSNAAPVILDTNILEHHLEDLERSDWHQALGILRSRTVVLLVPMVVIDELDSHKRSSNTPKGSKKSLRTLAQDALRLLEKAITDPEEWATLVGAASSAAGHTGAICLALAPEEVGHIPIPHTDSEIVARGAALRPLVLDVYLVSNDTGMLLRARKAGLKDHRHVDDLTPD